MTDNKNKLTRSYCLKRIREAAAFIDYYTLRISEYKAALSGAPGATITGAMNETLPPQKIRCFLEEAQKIIFLAKKTIYVYGELLKTLPADIDKKLLVPGVAIKFYTGPEKFKLVKMTGDYVIYTGKIDGEAFTGYANCDEIEAIG